MADDGFDWGAWYISLIITKIVIHYIRKWKQGQVSSEASDKPEGILDEYLLSCENREKIAGSMHIMTQSHIVPIVINSTMYLELYFLEKLAAGAAVSSRWRWEMQRMSRKHGRETQDAFVRLLPA